MRYPLFYMILQIQFYVSASILVAKRFKNPLFRKIKISVSRSFGKKYWIFILQIFIAGV